MVSMETVYKFDIVATKDAVRDTFDNAGLILALREAAGVIRTLSEELRQTRQEYKNYVAKTEKVLSGIKEYQKQDKTERKKIAKDVVRYWFEKVIWEIQKGHWYGHCNHYKNCSQREWVKQENVDLQVMENI